MINNSLRSYLDVIGDEKANVRNKIIFSFIIDLEIHFSVPDVFLIKVCVKCYS